MAGHPKVPAQRPPSDTQVRLMAQLRNLGHRGCQVYEADGLTVHAHWSDRRTLTVRYLPGPDLYQVRQSHLDRGWGMHHHDSGALDVEGLAEIVRSYR